TTIPAVVNFAEKQQIELPFTDYATLKTLALSEVTDKVANVGRYARAAFLQLAMLIIGLVVAVSLFVSAKWEVDDDPDVVKGSLYSTVIRELGVRFQTFYSSFARSEEHTSELQSRSDLVCRLLLEKKKKRK